MAVRAAARSGRTLFGLGVAALGVGVGWDTATLPSPPSYAHVGPKLFPYIVAAHLVAVGLALVVQAQTRERHAPPLVRGPLDVKALALVSGGLVVQMLLLEPLGFWLASALLFAVVARAFGSRRPLWDAALGLALGLAAQVAFVRGLGLTLPAGPLAGVL
ncbi:tripartite tricarboxylate transporter TctB family protein [Azospirillum sp. ST 5-10]|uniref:tripartite tricarboxylate transporter TctB family protein n=1 Tax=unclassified Azospirillum TaxID=2630922 RepID=UPI003F4A46E7